jgi:hypothetical protein
MDKKKCYNVMADLILFMWKWNLGWKIKRVGRIQGAEIKFLRSVRGCSKLYDITSVDIHKERNVCLVNGRMNFLQKNR